MTRPWVCCDESCCPEQPGGYPLRAPLWCASGGDCVAASRDPPMAACFKPPMAACFKPGTLAARGTRSASHTGDEPLAALPPYTSSRSPRITCPPTAPQAAPSAPVPHARTAATPYGLYILRSQPARAGRPWRPYTVRRQHARHRAAGTRGAVDGARPAVNPLRNTGSRRVAVNPLRDSSLIKVARGREPSQRCTRGAVRPLS